MKFDEVETTSLGEEPEEDGEIAIMSDSDEDSLHNDNNSNMDEEECDDEEEDIMDDESSIMDAIEEDNDVQDQDSEDLSGDTSVVMEDKKIPKDYKISPTLEEEVPIIELDESDPEDEPVDEEVEESDQDDEQEEEKNKNLKIREVVNNSSEVKAKKEPSENGKDKEIPGDQREDNFDNYLDQKFMKKESVSKSLDEALESKPTNPKTPMVIENTLKQVYDTLRILSKSFNFIVSARKTIYKNEEITLLEIYDPMTEKRHDLFPSFHLLVFEKQETLFLKIFYQQRKLVNETRLSNNVDPTILNEILSEYINEISPGKKKTCRGAFDDTMENVGFIDYKTVLIERDNSEIVYRSRECKVVISKGIICEPCKNLLETYLCKNGLKIKDKRKDSTVNKSMLVTSSGESLVQNIECIENIQHKLQGEKMGMTYKDFLVEAILESDDKKAKLSEIYTRIYKKYPHLKGEKQFENSLRHNLSLFKGQVFKQIVDVEKFGKGNYWSLMPGYIHQPRTVSQQKSALLLKQSVVNTQSTTDNKQILVPKSLTNTAAQNPLPQESRVRVRQDQAEQIERNIRARYEKSTFERVNIRNVRQPQMPQQMIVQQSKRSLNLPPSFAKEGLNSQIFSSPGSFSKPNTQSIAVPPQAVVNQTAWKSNPPKYLLVPKKDQSNGTGLSFLTQPSSKSTLNTGNKVLLNHRQSTANNFQLQNPTRKVFVNDGKLILQNNMSFLSNSATKIGLVQPSASIGNVGTTVLIKTIPRTLK